MAQLTQSSVRNLLLQILSAEEFALLAPHLEKIALPKGKVLIEPNVSIEHAIFPEEGIVSTVAVASEDRRVEVGITGLEGFLAPATVLDAETTPHQSFVQVEGSGYRIAAADLVCAIEDS